KRTRGTGTPRQDCREAGQRGRLSPRPHSACATHSPARSARRMAIVHGCVEETREPTCELAATDRSSRRTASANEGRSLTPPQTFHAARVYSVRLQFPRRLAGANCSWLKCSKI